MQDMLGQELRVGDTIAFPGRKGSSCWITVSKIEDFVTKSVYGVDVTKVRARPIKCSTDGSGKLATISRTDRIVKIISQLKIVETKSCEAKPTPITYPVIPKCMGEYKKDCKSRSICHSHCIYHAECKTQAATRWAD